MAVHLRELRSSDVARLAELAADPGTRLWNPMTGPDWAAWIGRQQGAQAAMTWAVADEHHLLGTIALCDIDRVQGTGELGYRVHPDARGRGVATTALALAASYAFGEVGLRRVEVFHALDNPASCVVAERAGFLLEGTLRQGYVYGDGQAHDEHLHARLRTD